MNVSSPVARALPPPWAFRQRQLSGYGTDGTDDGREETKDVEVTVPCQVTQRAEAGMSPKNLGFLPTWLVVEDQVLNKMIFSH